MKWLLDTNVISEGIRIRPSAKVERWLAGTPREELVISAITLAELRDGAATASNPERRAVLNSWVEDEIAPRFNERTLSITDDTLIQWIRISRRLRRAGKGREASDLLLAATARVHNLTLVSRNVRDFADTGIVVYDPWNDQTHRMNEP